MDKVTAKKRDFDSYFIKLYIIPHHTKLLERLKAALVHTVQLNKVVSPTTRCQKHTIDSLTYSVSLPSTRTKYFILLYMDFLLLFMAEFIDLE